jgi:hypothetical protein
LPCFLKSTCKVFFVGISCRFSKKIAAWFTVKYMALFFCRLVLV